MIVTEQVWLLQEREHLMQEIQDDADARMAKLERRRQPFQMRAIEAHVLVHEPQQQQQHAGLEEEDTDEVSLSTVEPSP